MSLTMQAVRLVVSKYSSQYLQLRTLSHKKIKVCVEPFLILWNRE